MSKRCISLCVVVYAATALLVLVGCGAPASPGARSAPAAPSAQSAAATITTPSGLQMADELVGTGEAAKTGDHVTVNYTGWLTDGTKFDSSLDRNKPFEFDLGAGRVIAGWDEGVVGMKVGGARRLTVPAELGYGSQGAGGVIPPDATLVFEVELLKVN